MSHSGGGSISVLHVDDEPSFGELTAAYLEREDDRFEVETVTRADEAMATLADRPPDCIVSDYNMPGKDGLEFLEAVRETHPDLPFILFTGRGSEQVASDAIAADVTDYLQKGSGSEQYELLANRIRNAVQARRTAETAARQEQLMRLTEFAGDTGGWELDLETEEIVMTEGVRRLVGFPDDVELSMSDAVAMYHPDDREEIRRAVDQVVETGETVESTYRLNTVDGEKRVVDLTIAPVTTNGDISALRGAVHDITDRRERRRELERTETLVEHAQDAMFLVDVGEAFTIEQVNPAYESATGVSADRIQGESPQAVFGEAGAAMAAKYRGCVEQRTPLQYDEQIHLDGETAHWETRIAPVVIEDTVEYIAGSTRDITEQRQRQRELEAERRFVEQALDTLDDLFYVVNPDGTLRRWNQRVPAVTGHTDAELAGMSAVDLFPPDEHGTVTDTIEATLSEGSTTVEADVRSADGGRIPHEFRGRRLTDADGETTGIVGIGRDLTERRRQERRFRALVEGSNDVVSIVDAGGVYQYQSPSLERVLGHDPEETVGDTAWEYIHPDDREAVRNTFGRWVAGTETVVTARYRARHADGSWRWMEARGSDHLDDPSIEGYVINSRDITEQRKDRAKLEEFETIVESLTDAVYVLDEAGRFTYVNMEFVELVGYDRETILGSGPSLIKDDEAVERAEQQLGRLLSSDGPDTLRFEVTIRPREGDPVVCQDHIRVLPYEGERFDGSVGVLRDISDQRARERRLSTVKHQYQTLVEQFPEGAVFLYDTDLRVVRAGGTGLSEVGLSAEAVEGSTPHDRYPTEISEELVQYLERALDGESNSFEQAYGGEQYRIRTVPVRNEGEEITRVMAVSTNVSEQREHRRELNRKRQRYTTLFETLPNPVLHARAENGEPVVQTVNQEFVDTFGCGDETVVGEPLREHVLAGGDGVDQFDQSILNGESVRTEIERETVDGIRTFQLSIKPRDIDDGHQEVYAVYTDITERIEYEQELERQNERLDEFASIVSHDLRNPLSVAKGRLELARESHESDHLTRAAGAIDRSQALIEDLLTLARQKQETNRVERVDLAELARQSWQTVDTGAATLTVETTQTVRADASQLQQLLENLYRNSVEHSSTDSQTAAKHRGDGVTVRLGEQQGGFYVADTGPGIPESERDRVFEAGYSTADGGTGFGLRIVEQVVDTHGWEVAVTESRQGGARFEITGVTADEN